MLIGATEKSNERGAKYLQKFCVFVLKKSLVTVKARLSRVLTDAFAIATADAGLSLGSVRSVTANEREGSVETRADAAVVA